MESRSQAWLFLSFLFFFSTITHFSSAADTISSGQSLTFGQTLISKGGNFELGFFNPGNSYNYYIGIWYKEASVQNKNCVWVANRDIPLDDPTDPTSSELKLLGDGNLVLYRNSELTVWSTNSTSNAINSSEAVLGDDGNLILRNGIRPSDVFWQSFDYPTHTFLPGGRIGYNRRTNKSQVLTSWKTPNDPSKGSFSLELDPIGDQLLIKLNRTQRYWTSGPWNGQNFSGVPELRLNYIFNFSYVKNENESYFTYGVYNSSILSRLVIAQSGQIQLTTWEEASQLWVLFWSQPRQQCYCGVFGVCRRDGLPLCECMNGFEPRSLKDWNMSDFSGGCVRKNYLQCGDKDEFFQMSNVSLLVNQQSLEVASSNECKSACSKNCNCSAYAYSINCSVWYGDLSGLTQLTDGDEGRSNLNVRLAVSELQNSGGTKKGEKTGVIIGTVAAVLVLGLIASYIGLKTRINRKGDIIINNRDIASTNERPKENFELPLFNLPTIALATNQFSFYNKIGQGGFGPVYKGALPTGEEIAIKRLSKDSRQGLQEFMNEVVLIAKLQHRNLVRLLGCCIQGEERMLIYEYMPNKSLDFFIFDETRRVNLDWNRRFNIIVGIARGLLYLHRDSRLRIIHRDLKAGNVLLDSQMNPKISDFGMARTFRAEQTEENTLRVVGTYGYMSPEYATDELFSMKSDVFSFGVLVLEIVSGKKNRGFHHADHDLNLLGHTWKLLNDNKALELIDSSINSPFTVSEVLKCIQVGLLCVQKFPEDRPEMSYVVSMLDSDGAMLPRPKQPGFYTERSPFQKDSSLAQDTAFTKNEVTVTLQEGR